MDRNYIASELLTAAKEMTARDKTAREWNEDDDADELREKSIREFSRHTDGEHIISAMKIRGDWVVFTTELGAYRLGSKYKRDWQDIKESKNLHRGSWLVWITG